MTTTPDAAEEAHQFTITHPFHPLVHQSFALLERRHAWGEWRVFFLDPQSQTIRSLPLAWTNLAFPDPFLLVAQGQTVLRFIDLQHLVQMLRNTQARAQEDE
ncbi:MAG: hypothetical protein H0X24_14280 [Ktedonobacterales bacterium]|nr:hypothetical protein [Ktedonobacterales bacterium]